MNLMLVEYRQTKGLLVTVLIDFELLYSSSDLMVRNVYLQKPSLTSSEV